MKRGFELIEGIDGKLPTRATKYSAGYDFYASCDIALPPFKVNQGSPTLVPTGVKVYMQKDECLKLYTRSSIPIKTGLLMSNCVGIIDADYYNNADNEGHVMFEYTNLSNKFVHIKKGSRIGQGIFEKYLLADNDSILEEVRNGGIGSTGVK